MLDGRDDLNSQVIRVDMQGDLGPTRDLQDLIDGREHGHLENEHREAAAWECTPSGPRGIREHCVPDKAPAGAVHLAGEAEGPPGKPTS
eukprot:7507671-Pyramimonas_sp.AAC.1